MLGMDHRKSVSPDFSREAASGTERGKPLALYSIAAWKGLQLAGRFNGALRRVGQPKEIPTPELSVWDAARRIDLFPTAHFA